MNRFDLLRSEGRSYVCDVNGWSFVKDSHKFWADSANLLRQYCLHAICAREGQMPTKETRLASSTRRSPLVN